MLLDEIVIAGITIREHVIHLIIQGVVVALAAVARALHPDGV